ncbi:helix-turn-helix domain-containing protein [Thermaerobacter sp. PB12/4term]|uniref:helix-turn-helix domain-containing protein n=1 Tax=Thermaerobacter sp. PB12/4term TaxID=2293838 RepID=UPI000E32586F|nr:helix-turn-helix domain-containing protein [Thermaerobacter sp. PB12/4term]QIA26198.1 helix-turn-helix domain-containing protein [Thermaerobacter sp. PB12/4term]
MQSDPVAVGQRIRLARQAAGLSVKDLARRAHISPSHLSDIERGVKHPSLAVAVTLAAALDRSLDWLVTGRDPLPGPLDLRNLLRDPTRPLRYQGLPLDDAAREHLVDLLDAALGLARLAGSMVVQALGAASGAASGPGPAPFAAGYPGAVTGRPGGAGTPGPAAGTTPSGVIQTPGPGPAGRPSPASYLDEPEAREWLRQVVADALQRAWGQPRVPSTPPFPGVAATGFPPPAAAGGKRVAGSPASAGPSAPRQSPVPGRFLSTEAGQPPAPGRDSGGPAGARHPGSS